MGNNFIKFSITLMLIITFCVSILAYINMKTKPIIIKQREEERKQAVLEVLPKGVTEFKEIGKDNDVFYIGYRDKEKTEVIGYASLAKGKGYSSTIEIMVGADTFLTVTGLKVISQQETPGLGTKINQSGKYQGKNDLLWINQFLGKSLETIFLDKDNPTAQSPIESVTGATISSRAATTAVKERLRFLQERTKKTE